VVCRLKKSLFYERKRRLKLKVGFLRYFLHVILPLLIGALIYLFLRSEAPIFVRSSYRFLREWLGIDLVPGIAWSLGSRWDWFVYNFPDGLWSYSLTSFLILTTLTDSRVTKSLYLFIGVAMMLVTERVLGTFDWLDVIAMFCGVFAAIWMLKDLLRK